MNYVNCSPYRVPIARLAAAQAALADGVSKKKAPAPVKKSQPKAKKSASKKAKISASLLRRSKALQVA